MAVLCAIFLDGWVFAWKSNFENVKCEIGPSFFYERVSEIRYAPPVCFALVCLFGHVYLFFPDF